MSAVRVEVEAEVETETFSGLDFLALANIENESFADVEYTTAQQK